ncbi:type I-E CRISPR-associated protein Cas5/CasD [Stomatobaculum longum]|jgi:CRISPR system CASCADE complex protein casD|uniref:type I-E CRISPR-associated protein Cas5/CasD n=1 Tax=Stomatobaculum longum TaxID=796942 RepID=UPI0028DC30BD|nr:type I-E CRISPR-associated protein Cas5/CasD [Stomatobaculum longum]
MSTLLLRLAAPLQAWGTDSKFEVRRTNREPSKSGVIGLLAAALGLRRDADLSKLSALRFGVRVDRNGEVIKDFHMAKAEKTSYLTYRYYLSDAIFLVGLESEDRSFLEQIERALRNPCFPLFLGRRSCPPTLPLVLGIREDALETALRGEENQNKDLKSIRQSHRYIRLDCGVGEQEGAVVQDLPISFNPMKREFGYRRAKEIWIRDDVNTEGSAEEHDAMAEL